MAATPSYASTPFCPSVTISTANANRNGTGTIGAMTAAPTGGARIDDILITAQGTTTAGMVRMFRYDGSTYTYMDEFQVTAITPNATTIDPWGIQLFNLGIILEAGQSLAFSTEKAEAFNVIVTRGGRFA